MLQFLNFTLQGTIPHVDTKIAFRDGVNIVRGPNFSGKSTIWLLLGQLVTGELPYTPKREKDNKGRLSLAFSRNGQYCEIAYDLDKNRPVNIIENGQSVLSHRSPDMLAKLDELLPFTLASWQNSSYLSNDTFPYLLRGSPLQRKQLFEALFDIDTDKQYKFFKRLSGHMDALEIKRQTLKEIDIERVFKKDLLDLEDRVEATRSELSKLDVDLKTYRKFKQAQDAWEPYARDFKHFNKMSAEKLNNRLRQLDPSKLYDELEAAKAFDALAAANIEYQKAGKLHYDAEQAYNKYKTQLNLVLKQVEGLVNLKDRYLDLLHAYKDEPEQPDVEAIQFELTKVERRIKALEHASACPLCSTKLDAKTKKLTLSVLENDREDLAAKLEAADILEKEGVGDLVRVLSRLELTWKDAAYWAGQREQLVAYMALDAAEENLANNPPVNLPKKEPRTVDEVRADIDLCKRETKAIEAYFTFNDAAVDTCFSKSSIDRDVEAEAEELQTKLRAMEDVLAEQRYAYKKYSNLRKEISLCSHALRMKPAVDSIKSLYGPKGLRAARVRDAVEFYTDNLNNEARNILPGYRFFVEAVDAGINLKCERPAGTSDVRRFSGAEGKLLPLLSLLALNPLLPDDKLSNLLVLDEPEQGMRDDTRKLFVDEIVPRLQEMFPSLWIVSPLRTEEYPINVPDCTTYEYETEMDDAGSSHLIQL